MKYATILFRWTLRRQVFADNKITKYIVLFNESLKPLVDCEKN